MLTYSCAYFKSPEDTLVQAQKNKIEHILRKLKLQEGQSLPDIGCGWGELIIAAAREYHVKALGITLSQEQYDKVLDRINHENLNDLVDVQLLDASFGSSVPHIETSHPSYDNIVPIFYMDTLAGINFIPTEYVDISDTIDLKMQALAYHKSQMNWMYEHDKIDFLDFVKTTSKFRGLQCGSAFAEGFRQCLAWPRVTTKRLLPQ